MDHPKKSQTEKLIQEFPIKKLLNELTIFDIKLTQDEPTSEEIKKLIDIKSNQSKAHRQDLWELISALPLDHEIKAYARSRLTQRKRRKKNKNNESSESNLEEILMFTPQIRLLPFTAMPHIDTYLDAVQDETSLEIPPAVILITSTEGNSTILRLTQTQTSATLSYVRRKIQKYQKNQESFELEYRRLHQIPPHITVDQRVVKNLAIAKLIKTRLHDVTQSFATSEITISPTDTISLHFTQVFKGSPNKKIRTLMENEQGEMDDFFESRMINLSTVQDDISSDDIEWKEPNEAQNIPIYSTQSNSGRPMNPLQEAQITINHATKTGNWEKAVQLYVQYLEYWPQHLEHLVGALKIKSLADRGIIKQPKSILSIASGPHEELRAHMHIKIKDPEYAMPHVTNIDGSAEMLNASSKILPVDAHTYTTDIIGDMRELDAIIQEDSFDLVECSSFDNLTDQSEITSMIIQAIGLLNVGGVLKFSTHKPFSKEFIDACSTAGIEFIMENRKPKLSPDVQNTIRTKYDEPTLERVKYKLGRLALTIAHITRHIDIPALSQALEGIPIYTENNKMTGSNLKKRIHKSVDDEIFDFNAYVTVALNPAFFLKNKKLKPEYLQWSLEQLKGKIGHALKKKLYEKYLSEKSDEILIPYRPTIIDIIADDERASHWIKIEWIQHQNNTLAQATSLFWKKQFMSHPEYLAQSWLSKEQKLLLLNTLTITQANKIINKQLRKATQTNNIHDFSTIFETVEGFTGIQLDAQVQLFARIHNVGSITTDINNDEWNIVLSNIDKYEDFFLDNEQTCIDFVLARKTQNNELMTLLFNALLPLWLNDYPAESALRLHALYNIYNLLAHNQIIKETINKALASAAYNNNESTIQALYELTENDSSLHVPPGTQEHFNITWTRDATYNNTEIAAVFTNPHFTTNTKEKYVATAIQMLADVNHQLLRTNLEQFLWINPEIAENYTEKLQNMYENLFESHGNSVTTKELKQAYLLCKYTPKESTSISPETQLAWNLEQFIHHEYHSNDWAGAMLHAYIGQKLTLKEIITISKNTLRNTRLTIHYRAHQYFQAQHENGILKILNEIKSKENPPIHDLEWIYKEPTDIFNDINNSTLIAFKCDLLSRALNIIEKNLDQKITNHVLWFAEKYMDHIDLEEDILERIIKIFFKRTKIQNKQVSKPHPNLTTLLTEYQEKEIGNIRPITLTGNESTEDLNNIASAIIKDQQFHFLQSANITPILHKQMQELQEQNIGEEIRILLEILEQDFNNNRINIQDELTEWFASYSTQNAIDPKKLLRQFIISISSSPHSTFAQHIRKWTATIIDDIITYEPTGLELVKILQAFTTKDQNALKSISENKRIITPHHISNTIIQKNFIYLEILNTGMSVRTSTMSFKKQAIKKFNEGKTAHVFSDNKRLMITGIHNDGFLTGSIFNN